MRGEAVCVLRSRMLLPCVLNELQLDKSSAQWASVRVRWRVMRERARLRATRGRAGRSWTARFAVR